MKQLRKKIKYLNPDLSDSFSELPYPSIALVSFPPGLGRDPALIHINQSDETSRLTAAIPVGS
jgi:hypothetical protein